MVADKRRTHGTKRVWVIRLLNLFQFRAALGSDPATHYTQRPSSSLWATSPHHGAHGEREWWDVASKTREDGVGQGLPCCVVKPPPHLWGEVEPAEKPAWRAARIAQVGMGLARRNKNPTRQRTAPKGNNTHTHMGHWVSHRRNPRLLEAYIQRSGGKKTPSPSDFEAFAKADLLALFLGLAFPRPHPTLQRNQKAKRQRLRARVWGGGGALCRLSFGLAIIHSFLLHLGSAWTVQPISMPSSSFPPPYKHAITTTRYLFWSDGSLA